ncbi:MAG TPA: alpha/beta hydrolase [Burkholderiales bacterium]
MEIAKTQMMPDGAVLRYGLSRAARPRGVIVLLHGMASNRTRWSEFIERTVLKRDWDILCLDLRGHGESMVRGSVGMKIWSDDLANLLNAEGYDRALLIGHSLGAHLALRFAVRHPTRVHGLVLIDPVFQQALRGRKRWQVRLRPLVALVAASIRFANALGLHRGKLPQRDLRALDERVRAELLACGNAEEFVRRYSSAWADIKFFPVASYVQELSEMMRPLPHPASIAAPILVLLSRGVTYTDPAATERLLDASPNTERVTLDAYHWPLTETPDQVREAIEVWIAKLR